MQTLHLRFRDLRAISPGQSPSRWQTPSMQGASKWKGAPPLPNLPKPTSAVGSHPEPSHHRPDRCPTVGAGLPLASPFREAHGVGPHGAAMCQVCRWQTARSLSPYPAHHEAGDMGAEDGQARASAVRCTPSHGLSFPLRSAHHKAGASGEKTVGQLSDGSGTRCSEAPGFRPTGRLKPASSTRVTGQASTSSCADAPALVTGQVPVGMDMPGVSQRPNFRLCSVVC